MYQKIGGVADLQPVRGAPFQFAISKFQIAYLFQISVLISGHFHSKQKSSDKLY